MNDRSKTYVMLEILCVFFWFLLDGFWLLEWKILTYGFSVIAIITAILMFFYIKRERVVVLIACADTTWLLLNILWAVGDLSHIEGAINTARILFFMGGLLCFIAFLSADVSKRMYVLVLSRLRILKFFERS